MKLERALMSVLLSGALALPAMAQSGATTPSGSDQNSAQQSQSNSSSSSQSSMPQSDQQSDTSATTGGKKSGKSKNNPDATNASASGTNMKTVSRKDRLFMEKAAAGGLMEVDLGNAVKDKASDQQVKDFASKMVEDHSKANDELKNLMSQKGLSAPTEIPAKDKAKGDKIKGMQGAELDKAYMSEMVKDHNKDVKEFQDEAQKGNDPDVKAWAQKTVTVLQQHQQMANDVAQKVGASGGKAAKGDKGDKGADKSKGQ